MAPKTLLLTGISCWVAATSAVHTAQATTLRSSIKSHSEDMHTEKTFALEDYSTNTVGATEGCFDALVKLRASVGTVDPALKPLVKDIKDEDAAKKAVYGLSEHNANTCKASNEIDLTKLKSLVIPLETATNGNVTFDCSALLNSTFTDGVKALEGVKDFDPKTTQFTPGKGPFNSLALQNLAYLMWENNTKVSCANTKTCSEGNNYLLCQFDGALTEGKNPFSTSLYNKLLGREESTAKSIGFTAAAVFFVAAAQLIY